MLLHRKWIDTNKKMELFLLISLLYDTLPSIYAASGIMKDCYKYRNFQLKWDTF